MCLVTQMVRAPVRCSEDCEQHKLAVCLSDHLPMTVCLAVSVLCSFYLFCRPVLLDYLIAEVVRVPDPIGDIFIFSKYVGLYPAPTLSPKKYKEYQAYPKYLKFSNPKHIFQYCTLTLRKALKSIGMTSQKVQKIIHNFIRSLNILFIFLTHLPFQKKKKKKK